MQNRTFVLDTNKKPLDPCHPARARELLRKGKAAVYRRYPFTIILNYAVDAEPAPAHFDTLFPASHQSKTGKSVSKLKVDPGSKTTGIVIVQHGRVVWAAELEHRRQQIKNDLEKRRAIRRSRRNRKTRYRKPRFNNRTRPKGWLAPSLKSRVDNLQTWFVRLYKLCPIEAISMELVRFDTQLMQNAEISGVEYQQGELAGYEVREYLLEKFGRKCCYCGATDVALEIEHIVPKSRGGSNRVSNLCTACRPCNVDKANQTAAEFGHPNVQALARKPLKDAAAVNATRWATWRMFDATGLPVEVGTGGRTKFNRRTQDYPKAHWIDAACVGRSGQPVRLDPNHQPLRIKAVGRGSRQMCRMNKYGFPRTKPKVFKRVHGFQTGDMVKAVVPSGKKKGVHVGAVAVRASGSFRAGKVDGVNWKYCQMLHRSDGYSYSFEAALPYRAASLPPDA